MNKEKFNKKKLMTFGLLSLFAFALVSAGLVGYLSNTVQADIDVSSPLVVTEIIGDLSDVKGGETVVISFTVNNLADVEIFGVVRTVIHSPGISVNDFVSIMTVVSEGSWATNQFDSLAPGVNVWDNSDPSVNLGPMIASVEIDGNNLVILSPLQPWQPNKTPWTFTSDITFMPNVVGDYNIAVTMIPQ